MSFNDKYKPIKELCAKELSKIEKILISNIKVQQELQPYIIKFLSSPSKRIRPVLSLLYLYATGIKPQNPHLEVLTAIELIHNASLVHDDIIDQSDIRRGQKTLSYEFGNKLGVICGDYLLSVAMELIIKQNSIEILNLTTNTLKKMCLGEINQHFDKFKIGTIDNYIEKSKNKTGYLFQTSVTASLILENISKFDIMRASEFGLNFGIAFQLRDDILNLISNDDSKPFKSDLKEGIYTASVIYAGNSEDYLQGVEKARRLLNNYIEKANENLKELEQNKYTLALQDLLELLKYE